MFHNKFFSLLLILAVGGFSKQIQSNKVIIENFNSKIEKVSYFKFHYLFNSKLCTHWFSSFGKRFQLEKTAEQEIVSKILETNKNVNTVISFHDANDNLIAIVKSNLKKTSEVLINYAKSKTSHKPKAVKVIRQKCIKRRVVTTYYDKNNNPIHLGNPTWGMSSIGFELDKFGQLTPEAKEIIDKRIDISELTQIINNENRYKWF